MDNETIKQLDIWESLAESERERLLHEASVRVVPKDNILFHGGEKGDTVFVLLAGKVSLKQSTEGSEDLIIHVVRPGIIDVLTNHLYFLK